MLLVVIYRVVSMNNDSPSPASARLDLVGMGELMKLLGVSRSRVWQISLRPDFPPPVATLIMGKIWLLDDITRWADQRGRTLRPAAPPSTERRAAAPGPVSGQRYPIRARARALDPDPVEPPEGPHPAQ